MQRAVQDHGLPAEPKQIIAALDGNTATLESESDLVFRVDFCTACFGRVWQLWTALPINMVHVEVSEAGALSLHVIACHPERQKGLMPMQGRMIRCIHAKTLREDFEETKPFIQQNVGDELMDGDLRLPT